MIRDVRLSAADWDHEYITEPPNRILAVSVISGDAFLTLHAADVNGHPVEQLCRFQVPARSLLLALRAVVHDDHPSTAEPNIGASTDPAAVRPPHSHQPWTPELDTQLRDTWLASSPAMDADATVLEIAQLMGRSRNGIRSRLTRLGCDPDVPWRALDHASRQAAGDQDDRGHRDDVGEHGDAASPPGTASVPELGQM